MNLSTPAMPLGLPPTVQPIPTAAVAAAHRATTGARLMPITHRPEQVFVRGEGAWLWDAEGRRYLDWLQGWAVNALGHCPPVLAAALQTQASLLLTPSPALHNLPSAQLAERLCALSGMHQAWFGSTGAEANEGAIKLARKWGRLHKGGAHEIITFDNAFHGRNLATMAASGKPGWEQLFVPQMPGFAKAAWNDLDSVRGLIGPQTVAVMLEPVQGEAGVRPASDAFLQGLRALCDTHGLLLIFDEVQTGCGRLGRLFAFEHYGVTPDILTLGKGLGGGVPISAVLAQSHACTFEPGDQGGTYSGNPLMAAASLAVLGELSQPAFLAGVRARGGALRAGLARLSARWGLGEVRGEGLLLALELGSPRAAEVVVAAREVGLLVNAARPTCLRFMPRLNSTSDEIDDGLARLDAALARVCAAVPAGA
jgi:acetylornithine/N-succinyldiaminopimelate aminotransferase